MIEEALGPLLESMMGRIAEGRQSMHQRSAQNPDENPRFENVFQAQEMYPADHQNLLGQTMNQNLGAGRNRPMAATGTGYSRVDNRTSTPIQINSRMEQRPASVPENPQLDDRSQMRPPIMMNSENRYFQNQNKIPINKWPIRFSGDPKGMSVEEFLKRVDVLARNNQVSEQELLSKANFLFRPESPAEIWYYTFSNKFTNWQTLKYYLRLRFEVPNKDKVIEREIRDRKQMPNETFVTFMGEIERLCQQLSRPMSERAKRSILLDNMRDWYRPHLAFIDTETMDIETLSSLCYELDKSVYRSYAQRSRPYNVHCIDDHETEDEQELEDPEINAITRGRQRNPQPTANLPTGEGKKEISMEPINGQPSSILCWNCRQFGHYWRDCSKNKRLFCHICGQPEVVVMNCPGNHRHSQPESKNEMSGGN